jgi:hypothetical protein
MGLFFAKRIKMAAGASGNRKWSFALWAASTILVSAFLLFQVQPVISKMILPWFGGSSAVWSTCMLFFQIVLLAGYGYAHWLTQTFTPRRQVSIHVGLLALAILTLPITPSDYWRPVDGSHPSVRILMVLARHVGLPYFLLSTTGPLVQAWFGRVYEGKSPYRLYALSNIGSLTALLSYPFLVEPNFTLGQQDIYWSLGFGLFGLLSGVLAWNVWRFAELPAAPVAADQSPSSESQESIPVERKVTWVLLPALASIALLAVTNHLSQDVAAVPFLWVLPLSLYLLSFILCFDSDRWYVRAFFAPAAMASILWLCLLESADSMDVHFKHAHWAFGTGQEAVEHPVSYLIDGGMNRLIGWTNIMLSGFGAFRIEQFQTNEFDYNPLFQGLFYLSSLFFGCMVCHGELARLKPGKQRLTEYYLSISAGGALGGVFVALLCPLLFVWYAELPLAQAGIFLVSGVAVGLMVFGKLSGDQPANKWLRFTLCAIALSGVGVLSADSSLKHVESETLRGVACLVMAMIAAALSYGIVATSRRELQIMCSAVAGLLMLSGLFGIVLGNVIKVKDANVVAAERSFYGALQVRDTAEGANGHPGRWLTHGRIQHGFQHLGPEMSLAKREQIAAEYLPLRYQPATYYTRGSGIGLAVERHPNFVQGRPFKIGVVGLGTGTIAAYGRAGDEIRFYEIDETVKRLSEAHFTFRQDTPAKADEVVLGDARLQMEREEPQNYDVLAIDAFSGDAIPVHLLTRECLAVYQKHLKPDGILAVHISNRYLDLAPIVRALAERGKMRVESFHYNEHPDSPVQDTASEWMLATTNLAFFEDDVVKGAITPLRQRRVIEWTDQYSNLKDILRW